MFKRTAPWISLLCILACAALPQEIACQDDSVKKKFEAYYQQWKKECKKISFSSSTYDYIGLPAFRSLVAMGREALPLLKKKMEEDQGLDFMLAFAVVDICGWNRSEFRGGSEQNFRDKVLAKLNSKF